MSNACAHISSGTVAPVSHRSLFSDAQNNVHNRRSWKMIWKAVGLCVADVLWSFLALCFLVAFCAHKISAHLLRKYERCRIYVLFQDLIRYGKTKQNLKRDDWLRVFDVPKR